jgi:hypothetical protein
MHLRLNAVRDSYLREDKPLRENTFEARTYWGKTVPKTIDAVRLNDHYVDLETVKEKAAGIISFSILAGIMTFSFIVLFF